MIACVRTLELIESHPKGYFVLKEEERGYSN